MVNKVCSYVLRFSMGTLGLLLAVNAQAAFQFGFANEADIFRSFTIDCKRGGVESRCALGGDTGAYTNSTPFLQELLFVDGNTYYHSVVGDPTSDFVQEVYIRTGGCCYPNNFPRSASEFSGDGNPTRVAMRTMVKDAEMTQWFIKEELAFKPLITQSVENSELLMTFEADMSAIDYSNLDTAGDVSIKLQLLQDAFVNAGDYDNKVIPSFFSDKSNVNQIISAGRYIYTPGVGFGSSGGVYTSWDGGSYEQYLADENLFRRAELNPDPNSRLGFP